MGIDAARVRAVLFDIDGTLRDTDDEVVDRAAAVLRHLIGERRAHHWARLAVMRMENPLQHLLSQADRFNFDGAVNRLAARLGAGGRTGTRLTPGAAQAVAVIGARFPIGVVSAGPAVLVDRFLDEHDLRAAMRVVVTGQTCKRTKPHPDPVLAALARLGVDASSGLMVGDTPVDIRAGKSAGAQTVGVLTGFGEREELERAGADLIVGTLVELAALLGDA